MKRISALFTLMIPAAPKPCSIRAMISVVRDEDSAQAREAIGNSTTKVSPRPMVRIAHIRCGIGTPSGAVTLRLIGMALSAIGSGIRRQGWLRQTLQHRLHG